MLAVTPPTRHSLARSHAQTPERSETVGSIRCRRHLLKNPDWAGSKGTAPQAAATPRNARVASHAHGRAHERDDDKVRVRGHNLRDHVHDPIQRPTHRWSAIQRRHEGLPTPTARCRPTAPTGKISDAA